MTFDPTGWIDAQRVAGDKRGNVFADILAAACAHRLRDRAGPGWDERRATRVQETRQAAAADDALVEGSLRGYGPTPSFGEMVNRWKDRT